MRQPVCHLETEAEYFHRLDAELIESMHSRAALEQRRLCLAEASQAHDPATLEALEKLGFDATTVPALFLVPLVHVAWVDGSVSEVERERIIAIASLRGMKADASAYRRVMAWLDHRPTDDFFHGSLAAIERILRSLPTNECKACKEAILLCCREVALPPGGVFGWRHPVCAAKRKLIREISQELELNTQVPA